MMRSKYIHHMEVEVIAIMLWVNWLLHLAAPQYYGVEVLILNYGSALLGGCTFTEKDREHHLRGIISTWVCTGLAWNFGLYITGMDRKHNPPGAIPLWVCWLLLEIVDALYWNIPV